MIQYNKLHAEPKRGKTLDIVLKKLKHSVVENMSSETADALGLSRAILCNDSLVKKLGELERNATMYKGLMEHTKKLLRAYWNLAQTHKGSFQQIIYVVVTLKQPIMARLSQSLMTDLISGGGGRRRQGFKALGAKK